MTSECVLPTPLRICPPQTEWTYLVLVAGPLTVLGETLQGLVDEGYVLLVDVEAEEAQAARGASTDAVQELQGLAHQIVVGLVILATEEVLRLGSPQVGGAKGEKREKVTYPATQTESHGSVPWMGEPLCRETQHPQNGRVSPQGGQQQWPSTLRPVPQGDCVWDAVEEGWPLTAHCRLLQPFESHSPLPHSGPPALSPGVKLTGTWHFQER